MLGDLAAYAIHAVAGGDPVEEFHEFRARNADSDQIAGAGRLSIVADAATDLGFDRGWPRRYSSRVPVGRIGG
jgi:hypothetical protein